MHIRIYKLYICTITFTYHPHPIIASHPILQHLDTSITSRDVAHNQEVAMDELELARLTLLPDMLHERLNVLICLPQRIQSFDQVAIESHPIILCPAVENLLVECDVELVDGE